MIEITVDEILKNYYHAIDSSKLSEDNIIIDENLKVEDSKNKYLREFAYFLNNSYFRGYKISESIIAKLMNIIEYEGYEYQIIKQYIKILEDAMFNNETPVYGDLEPLKCIEYINIYLSLDDNKIVIYNNHQKFSYENAKYILTEISDPIPIIVKDMQEWIKIHSEE